MGKLPRHPYDAYPDIDPLPLGSGGRRRVGKRVSPRKTRSLALAKKTAELTVALHGVLTKAIEAERGSLNGEDLENMQEWLNLHCSDLVSDCTTHALAASGVDMSDVHVSIPDFAALVAAGPVSPRSRQAVDEVFLSTIPDNGKPRSCPEQVTQAACIASLKGGA